MNKSKSERARRQAYQNQRCVALMQTVRTPSASHDRFAHAGWMSSTVVGRTRYWVAIQLELSRRTHRLHRWRQLLLCFVRHTGRFLQTGHMRSAMYTSCPRRRRRATRPSQTTGGVRPDRLSAWWQASPCFSMSPALPDGPAGGGVLPRRRDARERHPPGPSRHRPGS